MALSSDEEVSWSDPATTTTSASDVPASVVVLRIDEVTEAQPLSEVCASHSEAVYMSPTKSSSSWARALELSNAVQMYSPLTSQEDELSTVTPQQLHDVCQLQSPEQDASVVAAEHD
jgi:hypothetical protein